ncbi:unnamed protein product [Phytomonas sp. EM1]|nr:unnamed protein product [Phytomonas sp. EM1]|eukprot:CCW61042.1 unnamed protein product [Phytomonas sp. isolate EM1]
MHQLILGKLIKGDLICFKFVKISLCKKRVDFYCFTFSV